MIRKSYEKLIRTVDTNQIDSYVDIKHTDQVDP